MSLPVINGNSRSKLHNFYANLLGHVQALDTLGKLEQVAGNVRSTLDKLLGIRADLIRAEKDRKSWTFTELVEALRQWVERKVSKLRHRENQFATRDYSKPRRCVYCESDDHRATECTKLLISASVRKF